jgi:hypothetical protein
MHDEMTTDALAKLFNVTPKTIADLGEAVDRVASSIWTPKGCFVPQQLAGGESLLRKVE